MLYDWFKCMGTSPHLDKYHWEKQNVLEKDRKNPTQIFVAASFNCLIYHSSLDYSWIVDSQIRWFLDFSYIFFFFHCSSRISQNASQMNRYEIIVNIFNKINDELPIFEMWMAESLSMLKSNKTNLMKMIHWKWNDEGRLLLLLDALLLFSPSSSTAVPFFYLF